MDDEGVNFLEEMKHAYMAWRFATIDSSWSVKGPTLLTIIEGCDDEQEDDSEILLGIIDFCLIF